MKPKQPFTKRYSKNPSIEITFKREKRELLIKVEFTN